MPLNQASLLYHILRGLDCRLCDNPKSERGKRPLYAARNLAKYGNGVGWTRRIPAAEWRNRGGGRGETESPADAERGGGGGRENPCGGRKKCFGGRESCWGGKMPRTGAGAFRVGRAGRGEKRARQMKKESRGKLPRLLFRLFGQAVRRPSRPPSRSSPWRRPSREPSR